jgi:hypothetical protein
VREIVPPDELKKLQESAEARKREVGQLMAQIHNRRLTSREQEVVDRVESFLKLSSQAQERGDIRQASVLLEHAWVLARDLRSGR